jgi:type III pantothenate kinase
VIFPGVEISLEALSARAAALPTIDLSPPRALIGKSTVDAIRAGVLYGFAGMVDGIIGRLHDELGDFRTLATGGLAGAVVPHCRTIDEADDLLTLTGLRLIWELNSSPA